MLKLEVYALLIIVGITNTSPIMQKKPSEDEIFLNTFADYLISVMRMALPDPLKMNRSPDTLITIENASIYGLRHTVRSCPVRLSTYSTPDNDYISCFLCLVLKDYFKVDGLFQISTFIYDTDFYPSVLQLFNYTASFNLTLTLPKVNLNTTEALLHLDGTPRVEFSRLQFSSPPNVDEDSSFSFLTEMTSLLSSGPFGGYMEAKIGSSIRKTIKNADEEIHKTITDIVKRLTKFRLN